MINRSKYKFFRVASCGPNTKEKNMKKTRKIIALMLALALLLSAMAGMLVSCKGNDPEDPENPEEPENPGTPGEKTSYTVSVKTAGGMPLSGVTVVVYADSSLDDMEGFASTDANGVAKLSLYQSNKYAVTIDGVPDGYDVAESYSFSGTTANISLASKLLPDTGLANVKYELGDVMHDFTVTNVDGQQIKLSDLLKEKELVMLNFWYIDCSACVLEFPSLQEAYSKSSEDVAVVAINPKTSDTETGVKMFRAEHSLTFDLVRETALANSFGVTNYPTSVFIDRYGVICFIEVGALTETKYFDKLFSHFTAEPYTQKLIYTYEDVAPAQKPDISMPSSGEIAAIVSPGAEITYSPETGSADAEWSWPFVITEKDGVQCIKTSNSQIDSSFAMMHAEVYLEAGQALKLEYQAFTEQGADLFYILVDGVSINTISGTSNGWETCYPYVAEQSATYEVSFIYMKDSSTDEKDDCVYIKSLSILNNVAEISTPTYIPRWAATEPSISGIGYDKYVEIVLGADGYYHVGSATGPLLLANMMGVTMLSSSDSVYSFVYNDMAYQGELAGIYDAVVKYCNYASNAAIGGLCTVDPTLKGYLEQIADAKGTEENNPKQWLQFCLYYDAYATGGVQLADPIAGLAYHSAYQAVVNESVGLDEYPNIYVYDRPIMPRGMFYKFTPTVSGAYKISTNQKNPKNDIAYSLNGWIFLEDGTNYYEYVISERIIDDSTNVFMYVYFEAGKDYYINIAYYDYYTVDSFGFKLEYLGESYEIFRAVSPGAPFTYEVDKGIVLYDKDTGALIEGGGDFFASITMNGGVPTKAFYDDVIYTLTLKEAIGPALDIGGVYIGTDKDGNAALTVTIDPTTMLVKFECTAAGTSFPTATVAYRMAEGEVTETIIPGGTKVIYNEADGYYYNVLPNGEMGSSKIYVDFTMITSIFSNKNLAMMIDARAFNFALTESDLNGLILLDQYGVDGLRDVWGDEYAENYALYQISDLLQGKYHGTGTDMTDIARKYYAQIIQDENAPLELRGCVAVNAELADLLQKLMDKYTFEGVENSWVKLCYYYETVDAGWVWQSPLR